MWSKVSAHGRPWAPHSGVGRSGEAADTGGPASPTFHVVDQFVLNTRYNRGLTYIRPARQRTMRDWTESYITFGRYNVSDWATMDR